MNRQHLLSRLAARGWPVCYSDGPLDRWALSADQWARAPLWTSGQPLDGVRIVRAGRLHAQIRSLPWLDALTSRAFSAALRNQALRGHGRPLGVVVFNPAFAPWVDRLRPNFVIHHAYDDFRGSGGWNERLESAYSRLVMRCDLITAVSATVREALPGDGAARAVILGNGVDFPLFESGALGPEPSDLATVRHPRLGYSGTINRKVDLRLIEVLSASNPAWNWVLVGRVERRSLQDDPATRDVLVRLESMPNVHFLGEKHHREVPRYVAHMDVNTLCYRTDGTCAWWHGGYPLKLHEYLSVGKPVVGVRMETVLPFEAVVDLADGRHQWQAAIERALVSGGQGSPEGRRRAARENDWGRLVGDWEKLLLGLPRVKERR